jgi:hypothetical protein
MSNSNHPDIIFDWWMIIYVGILIVGAVLIMLKLTVGSCYKPPPPILNQNENKKFM